MTPFVHGAALGRWQTNCFLVGDRDEGSCVVVDPGERGAEFVPGALDELEVTCTAILLTHGHLDHIWAVPQLADELDVAVFLHPDDRWLWDEPATGLGFPPEMLEQFMGAAWDPPTERLEDLKDGQSLNFAGIDLRVSHTPGHTPGHVTFLAEDLAGADVSFGRDPQVDEPGVLFSGDLVFQGSVGRTDFPRGSTEQLLDSIARTVLPLEDATLILSGHGPETTVGDERRDNPFLRRLTGRASDQPDRGGRLWTPGR